MATYIGLGSAEPSENSERIVANAFRTLGSEWTVIHHIIWQSQRYGREGDGEADFLLLHPRYGGIVVEVKGGGIDVDKGQWVSQDRNGHIHKIKNPYEQASASKHALVRWMKEVGFGSLPLGHAVVFPNVTKLPLLGPAAVPKITLLREQLLDVEQALRACAEHWSLGAKLSKLDIDRLVELLAPTVHVKRQLLEASNASELKLIELTAEQVSALSGLRSNRGGLIQGAAGTGKTVLAIARAKQLAQENFRTLFVCYNEILGTELSKSFDESSGISACTFHSLCFREASKAGLSVPSERDRDWWDVDAANMLVDACAKSGTTFDAIVVDEGQDFAPSWLDALRCLLVGRQNSPMYIFVDAKQDLWKRNWSQDREFDFTFQLTRNLRNTHQIAVKVYSSIGEQVKPPYGVDGPLPKWRDLLNEKQPYSEIISEVERLIDEGFGPKNLIVLCTSSSTATLLREFSVGPYSFGRWGGNGIPVETVARFKGMETEASVLVLDVGETDDDRTVAYVGFSRPRSVLVVLSNSKKQQLVSWALN